MKLAGLRRALPLAVVALVSVLPFARGLLGGRCFFFRDLAGYFLPLRGFVVEGLLRGQLRFWNPLVHEGEPLSLPPVSYPPDLLQVLLPGPAGVSLTLALHVPLAALGFVSLARRLGASGPAAAGGAFVYALGGFCLSSLNLYVYLLAMAWAPLTSLALIRSAERTWRSVAMAGVLVALAVSTTGIEIVAQAVVLGFVLSAPAAAGGLRASARWGRMLASVALGLGLAGFALIHAGGLVEGSARERGFETDVVLAHSVHPLTFLQVLIAGFHGDPSDLTARWWGQNFFPQGFPYLLSLYLGASALALASVGAACAPPRMRKRLLLLALAAVAACLGRYAGLLLAVEAVPLLRLFRYPSKVFFLVHTVVALLASFGLEALGRGSLPAWRRTALAAAALGAPLAAAPWLPSLSDRATSWFVAGFFPPGHAWQRRLEDLGRLLDDAAAGGVVALCVAGVAGLVLARRLAAPVAAAALAGLLAADLVRAGAGLNPMVDASYFRLSPPMASWAERFRERGARVFSCEPEFQRPFLRMRDALPGGRDAWTFAALAESFVPLHNMGPGVATALSRDRTMLVPTERTLSARQVACGEFDAMLDPLRRSGVSHVLSVVPLASPSLRLLEAAAPRNVAPLRVFVYALDGSLPLRAVARTLRRAADRHAAESLARTPGFQAAGGVAVEGGDREAAAADGRILFALESSERLEFVVEASGPTVLVVRDAFAPGWSASVQGRRVPLLRADGRHRAVPLPGGRSQVVLEYRPPGLAVGLGLSLTTALLLAGLWLGERVRRHPAG